MALTVVSRRAIPDAPGAELIIYSGSDPAANAEWSETVPTGRLWRILYIRATLVTDANAASRRVQVLVDDGTNVLYNGTDESTQAASLTHEYNIAMQMSRPVQDVQHYIPLPYMRLGPGSRVRSSTLLRQATDNWGAPILAVEETVP